jgi:hypothetical protein
MPTQFLRLMLDLAVPLVLQNLQHELYRTSTTLLGVHGDVQAQLSSMRRELEVKDCEVSQGPRPRAVYFLPWVT